MAAGEVPVAFEAWYLTEWDSIRLWPSQQVASRVAEAITALAFHSKTVRDAALRAISDEFRGAAEEHRGRAALSMEQVPDRAESMQIVRQILANAARYGATAEDFAEQVVEHKPSSCIAQPEFIVSPFNCWIDGSMIVKARVEDGEEARWVMNKDSVVAEPSSYAEFASRHPDLAQLHDRLMNLRSDLVDGSWCYAEAIKLDVCILAHEQKAAASGTNSALEDTGSLSGSGPASTSISSSGPRALMLVEQSSSSSEGEQEEVPDRARIVSSSSSGITRKPRGSAKWRQARERATKSPAALALMFRRLVLRALLEALRAALAGLHERLGLTKPYGDEILGGLGSAAQSFDSDSLRVRAEKLRMLLAQRHADLRQQCVEARHELAAKRREALAHQFALLTELVENPLKSDYTSTFWNTPTGGLPFEKLPPRQLKWAVRVQPGVYRGGDELCETITRALACVKGLPSNWRLVARFLHVENRAAHVQILVDRCLDPAEQRRQVMLKKMGMASRGWGGVECYIRLLFSSGPHARAALAPLISFTRQDTGWSAAHKSNATERGALALPRKEFVSALGRRFFLYKTGTHREKMRNTDVDTDVESRDDEDDCHVNQPHVAGFFGRSRPR